MQRTTPQGEHPVATLLSAALDGRYPPIDGGWTRVAPWTTGLEAALAFTGHGVLAVGDDVTDAAAYRLGANGVGGVHDPRLVAALVGDGWVESLDAVLMAWGTGGPMGDGGVGSPEVATPPPELELVLRPDLMGHPRVTHAQRVRRDVQAFGMPVGDDVVVSLGGGIGLLSEVGIELRGPMLGGGHAVQVVDAVRRLLPSTEPLVAEVAPGNTRAMRVFLAAGFRLVASAQTWRPAPHPTQPARPTPHPHPHLLR